jgi:hypothetical protein
MWSRGIILLSCQIVAILSYNGDNSVLESGQFQYNLIKRDSQMPKYGKCWISALDSLENGCRHLTDELQSRLALDFANCFLEKSGQKIYPCEKNQQMSECLRGVDSNAFSAYSNFFTVNF